MNIFKYTLSPCDSPGIFYVNMPQHAIPIACGMQDGNHVVWAMTDTRWATVRRPVLVWWTGGQTMPSKSPTGMPITGALTDWKHLGTYTDENGLVWHMFV